MFLDKLSDIDQKILKLLIENSRYTYSEIGSRLDISRIAVKNHIQELEASGVIESYTTIINPQKLSDSISCYFEIETKPEYFSETIGRLNSCPEITQIYQTTGACRLHVHAVLAGQDQLDHLLADVINKLPGAVSIQTNVILSRIKDVKGLRL